MNPGVSADERPRTRVRALAFYLPQYHPIPENDLWWGKGFTEWTNVVAARPLFAGHDQPHLPADLGFYDLRLGECRTAQAELARSAGIEGFCYWHYWFEGRRLLERPFDEVLASGQPDFPFCLAWANESWSRRWLGEESELLLQQSYSPEDDRRHAEWLVRAFADPRAVRIDGRPLFLVYRPTHLPEPLRTTAAIREASLRAGLAEPYLVGIDAHCAGMDCRALGFDTSLDFEPQLGVLPGAFEEGERLRVYDEREARALMAAARIARSHPTLPCVFVGWDNTPRRGARAIVLRSDSPRDFGEALERVVAGLEARVAGPRLLFLNAWNEWAEGNHLEPDRERGRASLEEVRRCLVAGVAQETQPATPAAGDREPVQEIGSSAPPATILFVSHDAFPAGSQFALLRLLRWLKRRGAPRFRLLLKRGGALERSFEELGELLVGPASLADAAAPAFEELRRRIREENIRLIVSNTITNGDLLASLGLEEIPVLCLVHELEYWIRNHVPAEDLSSLIGRADGYVAVSGAVRDCLVRVCGVPVERIAVVHGFLEQLPSLEAAWADRSRIRARYGVPDDAFAVGACGGTNWHKGPDLFVALARRLVRVTGAPRMHFLWIGGETEGPEAVRLRWDVVRSGLEGCVHLLGRQSDPLAHLAALDVLALTSREDSFPLVVLEAAALGVPTVCFEGAGGAVEFLRGDAGRAVDYLDLEGMAEAILEMARNPGLRHALGARGRQRVIAEHMVDVIGPRLLERFEKYLEGAPRVRE